MRRSPDGKPIRTKPRVPTFQPQRTTAYQHSGLPPGWKLRMWGGGAKLTRAEAMRGLGGGIQNDE